MSEEKNKEDLNTIEEEEEPNNNSDEEVEESDAGDDASEAGEESEVEEESDEEEEEEEVEVEVEGENPLDEEEGEEGVGVEGENPLENPLEEGAQPLKKRKAPPGSNKKKVIMTGIEMLKAENSQNINSAFEEESDEEPEEDENYLQKFDSEMRDNFIVNFHPEARTHNYEEVKALARVTRDGRGIIVDPLHKTLPFLTKYEMTRILGQRAKQLDSGAKPFVKIPLNVIDGYHIAKIELEQKKIPFIIKRPYPNGGVEYWSVSDLELI
jgi:DNA-directed RNA polymerase subunit K/omega